MPKILLTLALVIFTAQGMVFGAAVAPPSSEIIQQLTDPAKKYTVSADFKTALTNAVKRLIFALKKEVRIDSGKHKDTFYLALPNVAYLSDANSPFFSLDTITIEMNYTNNRWQYSEADKGYLDSMISTQVERLISGGKIIKKIPGNLFGYSDKVLGEASAEFFWQAILDRDYVYERKTNADVMGAIRDLYTLYTTLKDTDKATNFAGNFIENSYPDLAQLSRGRDDFTTYDRDENEIDNDRDFDYFRICLEFLKMIPEFTTPIEKLMLQIHELGDPVVEEIKSKNATATDQDIDKAFDRSYQNKKNQIQDLIRNFFDQEIKPKFITLISNDFAMVGLVMLENYVKAFTEARDPEILRDIYTEILKPEMFHEVKTTSEMNAEFESKKAKLKGKTDEDKRDKYNKLQYSYNSSALYRLYLKSIKESREKLAAQSAAGVPVNK